MTVRDICDIISLSRIDESATMRKREINKIVSRLQKLEGTEGATDKVRTAFPFIHDARSRRVPLADIAKTLGVERQALLMAYRREAIRLGLEPILLRPRLSKTENEKDKK